MSIVKITFPLIFGVALLSACAPPTPPSESVYRNNETRVSMSVDRCRVLDTRAIALAGTDDRLTTRSRLDPAQAGATIGGILGTAIGSTTGGDYAAASAAIGGTLGAAAGAAGGTHLSRHASRRDGVEYSVLVSRGGQARERIIAQDISAGDRIVQPGQTCRIASTPNGLRVLPASGLPARVDAPARSRFN